MCHTARVMCLSWSPNSKLIATGSIDTNVGIYDVAAKNSSLIKGKKRKQNISKVFVWTILWLRMLLNYYVLFGVFEFKMTLNVLRLTEQVPGGGR